MAHNYQQNAWVGTVTLEGGAPGLAIERFTRVGKDGIELRLGRDYISHGLRECAREAATQLLGERSLDARSSTMANRAPSPSAACIATRRSNTPSTVMSPPYASINVASMFIE